MKIAIVGSRDFARLDLVRALVSELSPRCCVVSGGARGVDEAAEETARARGLDVIIHHADWSKGRGAGFERNKLIVRDADVVVAFWDGKSRGTQHTLRLAHAAGKPTVTFRL